MNLLPKIALCDNCLQYPEDCECCTSCGCPDEHEYGCDQAETRRSMIVPKRRTLRGLGQELTYKTPTSVIRIDDACGHESTENKLWIHF
jgi:hypothetical protein